MNVPFWLLRLLPRWTHICPKCRKEVKANSHECPHCGEKYPLTLRVPPTFLKDPKKLEAYVHEHVFSRVSEFERNYLTKYFTTLFSDGFENNNFNLWTGTDGSPSIVVSPIHTETYAAKFISINGTAVDVYKTGFNSATLHSRAYFRFTNLSNITSGKMVGLMKLWDSSWGNTVDVYLAYNVGAGNVQCFLENGVTYSGFWGGALSDGIWYCVEIERTVGAGSGVMKLWIDGSLVGSLTSETITNNGAILHVGTYYNTVSDVNVYCDCVVVADAYIGPEYTTYTKTFTFDGLLQKSLTKTLTFDGLLQKSLTKTLTFDGVTLLQKTKDLTFDAALQKTLTKDFTFDATLQKEGSKPFTFDAALQKSLPQNFTFDGVLIRQDTKAFTFDGLLIRQDTKLFTLDGVLYREDTKSFTFDSNLLKNLPKNFTFDAHLQKSMPKLFSFDAQLQKTLTKDFTFDAQLKLEKTKTFTYDGQLIKSLTKTFTYDGVLYREDVKAFSFDALLQKSLPEGFTFDGLLYREDTKSFTYDALLQKNLTKTWTFDAILQALASGTKTYTFDGLLQKSLTKPFTFDAWLQALITPAPTVTEAGVYGTTRRWRINPELLRLIKIYLELKNQ